MKKYKIYAIHEREMDKFLENLHLLELLEEGKIKCGICGRKINKENFHCVYPLKNRIFVCCDMPECYKEVLRKKGLE